MRLISVFFVVAIVDSENPAVQIRINKKGFDFLAEHGPALLEQRVAKFHVPDFDEKVHGVQCQVWNFSVKEFVSPRFSVILSDDLITWNALGGKIKAHTNWRVAKKLLFKMSGSGTITASAEHVNIEMSAKIAVENGKPQLQLDKCSARVNDIDIKIRGKILATIARMFTNKLERKIRKKVEEKGCSMAEDFINEQNRKLAELPVEFGFRDKDKYKVELIMLDPVVIKPSHVEVNFAVKTKIGNDTCEVKPKPMTEPATDHMVSVYVSDAVLNCFIKNAYNENLFKGVAVRNDSSFLSTSCFTVCIGNYFEKLEQSYPDMDVYAKISTPKMPVIAVNDGAIRFNVENKIEIHVDNSTVGEPKVVTFYSNSSTILRIFIAEDKLLGKMDTFKVNFTTSDSSIGNFTDSSWMPLADTISSSILDKTNDKLGEGVLLPVYGNVQFTNETTFEMRDGYIAAWASLEAN